MNHRFLVLVGGLVVPAAVTWLSTMTVLGQGRPAGWKTASLVGGRTAASRRACGGAQEPRWSPRWRPERAAWRALHPDGPQRAAHAWRRLQQHLPDCAGARLRDDSRRDAPRRP